MFIVIQLNNLNKINNKYKYYRNAIIIEYECRYTHSYP